MKTVTQDPKPTKAEALAEAEKEMIGYEVIVEITINRKKSGYEATRSVAQAKHTRSPMASVQETLREMDRLVKQGHGEVAKTLKSLIADQAEAAPGFEPVDPPEEEPSL